MKMMDDSDINDEDFLKACEESSKYYAEVEVPMRKNATNNQVSCVTLDDSIENVDVDAQPDPGLFSGKEADGFDISTGSEWIYPTNYPIREYQKAIVSKALFSNTLVSLPTGLGKTFIAAVVMYNYHRWYPKNKIVFMAHSKPLVAQQVQACCNIMGISKQITAELNGNMLHQNRKIQWETKKIFFLTPQVFNNDLARGIVQPESIRCLVIDEAHKALGNQAYCQVISSIKPFSNQFRVLALSATPGDKMDMVQQVVQNLMIAHLEIRTEENPDVKPYLHQKNIEVIEVKLDEKIQEFKTKAEHVTENYLRPLANRKVIPQSRSSLNSFTLLLKQKEFNQDNSIPPNERGLILSNFCVAINLFKAIEELQIHGLRSFLNKLLNMQSGEGAKNNVHNRLAKDEDFKKLIQDLEDYLGPDKDIAFDPNTSLARIMDELDSVEPSQDNIYSHPKFKKLEEIITKHFNEFEGSTRVIIFCKSRPCTGEICNFLLKFRPLIKPMIFIGQSQTSTGTTCKGFNQATQLAVMKKFREGAYNTLVATCVAEEGLDIGEVDLIVNFDSTKNSNTQVQRSGRTGRKRDGRVVNLVTEGKEHRDYNESISKAKSMNKKLAGDLKNLPLYANNPRLLPQNVHPVCQEMNLSCPKEIHVEPSTSKKKTKANTTEGAKAKKPTKRKKKGDLNNDESVIPLDSDPLSSQSKSNKYDIRYAMQKAFDKNKTSQSSPHNDSSGSLFKTVGCANLIKDSKKKTKGKTKPKNNITKPKNLLNKIFPHKEIEVVELDNSKKFDGILYEDDVSGSKASENFDALLNFLNEDDAKAVKKFIENNKAVPRSKAKFSKLIDLEKISNCICPDIENVEILNDLKRVQDFFLTENDLKLSEADLDEVFFNVKPEITSPILSTPLSDRFVTKRRGYPRFNREETRNEVEDLTVDHFLSPMIADPSPFKGLKVLASSTPVKEVEVKEKEIIKDKAVIVRNPTPVKYDETLEEGINYLESKNDSNESSLKKSSLADFQFWDDDFFTQEKKNNNEEKFDDFVRPLPAKISTQVYDSSVVTISQAINMVDAFQTQKVGPEEKRTDCPPSPVLLSQKRKKPRVKQTGFFLFDSPKHKIMKEDSAKDSVEEIKILSPDPIPKVVGEDKTSQEVVEKLKEPEENEFAVDLDLSPLFVMTQKRRTPIKEKKFTLSGSPILSQKTKRKSKKSLKFDDFDKSEKSSPKEEEIKPWADVGSEEDLFLEAEREMENYKQKLPDVPEVREEEPEQFSQLTQAYHLDPVQLNATDLQKLRSSSVMELEKSNEIPLSQMDFGSNKENLSVFDYNFKAQKPPPKTAIVRPLGFEDKDDSDSEWLDKNVVIKPKKIDKKFNMSKKIVEKSSFSNFNSSVQKSNDKKLEEPKKKIFSADFNFFSDDFFEIPEEKNNKNESKDSDDSFNYRKKNKLKINDTLNSNKNDLDDGELSDGALEAIKAVEDFEKSERVAKAVESKKSVPINDRSAVNKKQKLCDFTFWDSDDSAEFFETSKKKEDKFNEPGPSRQKTWSKRETVIDLTDENDCLDNRLPKKKKTHKKKKKQQNPVSSFDFIELEAALSDDQVASTDEENTSGLDEYDSSFVDEREVLTQAPNVDMTAKYLQSTKSPISKNAGFKIPERKRPIDVNIFSQMPETEEVDYEHDSFCVDEIEEHDDHEMSALELAELILEQRKKKKRKRQGELETENKKTKHRRIIRIESESSEDESFQNISKSKSDENRTVDITSSRIVKPSEPLVKNTPQPKKVQNTPANRSLEKPAPRSASKQPKKQIIFISAKQLASCSEITTFLRAKWDVQVIVRSFLKADFIISWRTGINRITLSDFSNGGAQAKTTLKENTQELRTFFVNPVYIVEDDKNKGLPLTVGSHTTMWTKHTYDTLAKFFQSSVRIVFSRNKDETARIIAMFTKEEYDKGNGISINGNDISPRLETKLKFYKGLPSLNIAKALKICQKFRSVASFINICDSPEVIAVELDVDRALAIRIYQTLCNVPFT